MPSASWDVFDNLPPSPTSTASSFDEDEVNLRLRPNWPSYRGILKLRGFRLDTVGDAKAFYRCSADGRIPDYFLLKHSGDLNDALCPDAGLVSTLSSTRVTLVGKLAQPDNLFRGTRTCDGTKVVIKAVHLRSREFAVIRFLTTSPLRDDPMNHCIR